MSRYKLLYLFLSLHICLDCVQPKAVDEDHPFDLLIFTQQWPLSYCKEWEKKDPSHTCHLPSNPDTWTIHGVWPTKLHTMGPQFCNRSWHFDPEAVRPIETPLTELWTNIEGSPISYSLWAHEWTKHGTCAAVLPPLSSELKYFSKGLNWIEKYSMTKLLASYNIIPSNEKQYNIADINKAVTNTLHVHPVIECRKMEGKSWLVEIRICFDKTLHIADCDGVLGYKLKHAEDILTNCDVNESLYYPEKLEPAKTMYVQLYKLIYWLQWLTL